MSYRNPPRAVMQRMREDFEKFEEFEAVVFFGSNEGLGIQSLAMAIASSDALRHDYEQRGRETIEQMINSTKSSDDINAVVPWQAKECELLRVVGWIAWSVDDTDFFELEWDKL